MSDIDPVVLDLLDTDLLNTDPLDTDPAVLVARQAASRGRRPGVRPPPGCGRRGSPTRAGRARAWSGTSRSSTARCRTWGATAWPTTSATSPPTGPSAKSPPVRPTPRSACCPCAVCLPSPFAYFSRVFLSVLLLVVVLMFVSSVGLVLVLIVL